MSKYTTEIRFICESLTGHDESKGLNDVDEIIVQAAPLIFNFNFPLFDENYRLPLETKILRHYYTREISEETYGLWKLRLQDRLNILMPYYNKLYESALLSFNPLYDVDLTTEHSGNGMKTDSGEMKEKTERDNSQELNRNMNIDENGNKTGDIKDKGTKSQIINNSETEKESYDETNSYEKGTDYSGYNNEVNTGEKNTKGNDTTNTDTENENTSWTLFSDTPQGGINGVEGSGSSTIDSMYYLTTATKNTSSDEGSTDSTSEHNQNESAVNITDGTERYNTTENNEGSKNVNSNKINENTQIGDFSDDNTRTYNEENNNNINRNTIENANGNENESRNRTDNNVSTNTEEYLQHVSGKSGGMTYSAMLREYRETFINIDEMLIEELSDLFFGLW